MKLIALKDRVPSIPLVWFGFVLWIILFGALLFNLSVWITYILLGLLFIDKVFILLQFYAAVATAKATSFMLEAMVQTQLLVEEQSIEHMKMQRRERE